MTGWLKRGESGKKKLSLNMIHFTMINSLSGTSQGSLQVLTQESIGVKIDGDGKTD